MAPDGTTGPADEEFEDHFSGHAADYASHRPTYPAELFEFLAEVAPATDRAWDCATGSGQAAVALARHFAAVVATDASARQIAAARPHERVEYRREAAEATSLDDACCDLIAVAQAVHWLDRDRFFAEARRVARRRAVVAVWTYALMRVDPEVDHLIDRFHGATIGDYWPAERRLVDSRYGDIEMPFAAIASPSFEMSCRGTAESALDYINTWSGVKAYAADRGENPTLELAPKLRRAWGSGTRAVRWPLTVLAGRVE